MRQRLSSLIFVAWLYTSMFGFAMVGSPLLLLNRTHAVKWIKLWAQHALWALKVFCGVKVEFRGLEHVPQGRALIAGKHQSMVDTIAPFLVIDDTCFVLKRELTYLPFFGWFAIKAGMVAVRRADAAKALRQMVKDTKQAVNANSRQVLIFPEGTRQALEAPSDYKPGVAALYQVLDMPCHLMATNSGRYWPAHGVDRYPGTIVFEFLPPIPAGLKRTDLMREIETRLETASKALL